MAITDDTIPVDWTSSTTPPRKPVRWLIWIGAALVVVTALAVVAVLAIAAPTASDQSPEPAPLLRDDIVRDLVVRGVVPAASLDDGTRITGPALAPVPTTRDDVVRDLVARGVVPAATLDDGTEISRPAPTPWSPPSSSALCRT